MSSYNPQPNPKEEQQLAAYTQNGWDIRYEDLHNMEPIGKGSWF
jgi:hypothetical protein